MSPRGHTVMACHYVCALALGQWKTSVDLGIFPSPTQFNDANGVIRITFTRIVCIN